jgi:hypothetical protein
MNQKSLDALADTTIQVMKSALASRDARIAALEQRVNDLQQRLELEKRLDRLERRSATITTLDEDHVQ